MTYPVLIIGAGGWGREVLAQMQADPDCGKVWHICGFLDSRDSILDGLGCDAAIVGDPMTYQPGLDDRFVCAIGDPHERARYARLMLGKKARFIWIRTGALLSPRIRYGEGGILCHRVQLSPDVRLGDFVNVHSNALLGHDVRVGNYVQIGAMAFIGGGASVDDFATVNPHAVILPRIHVGKGAVVGAGAVVVKDVPDGATVFGNPARVIYYSNTI